MVSSASRDSGVSIVSVVSVVVPAFNAAETLQETLQSLAAQSYPALEVLVIDDGSTDATAEVARRALDSIELLRPNQFYYLYQSNMGQAAALNSGWAKASGEILGYLSADDILYPEAVARLVAELAARPKIAVVYPDYDLIDVNSHKIRRVYAPDFSAQDLIERSICQPGPGALFRSDHYRRTTGWNREYRLVPDFEFWLRLSRFGDFLRIKESLAGFRVHEGSQSFAVPSESKSEEPVRAITAFISSDANGVALEPVKSGEFHRGRAIAWAHVLSARLHLRAGRLHAFLRHILQAVTGHPLVLIHRRFWHLLGSGLLGRLRYQLNSSTQKRVVK